MSDQNNLRPITCGVLAIGTTFCLYPKGNRFMVMDCKLSEKEGMIDLVVKDGAGNVKAMTIRAK